MIIEDGKGSGKKAEVNEENELVVRAITEAEIEHASGKLGSAFVWDSLEKDIDAGDTMLFVQNTGSVPLILDRAEINGSNVICTWTYHLGSLTATPTGTSVIGVNMNRKFASDLSESLAFSDETALANGDIVGRVKTAIDDTKYVDLTGFILLKGHYIQFTQVTESTRGSIILTGHYENPS